MNVLVAEDDLTSRNILVAMFGKWGYSPVAVEDGTGAWEVMRQSDAPDLIILDWDMPGMDGLEVCRHTRESKTSRPPYIIMLTAKSDKMDIVCGLEAGANDYVSKPYDSQELQARVGVGRRMVELQNDLLEARNALAHAAMHDSLTGAPNRRAVLDALSREHARATREGTRLSIGLCDIDHFKQVNDRYGHQAGDEVLRGFVQALQGNIRNYDLVGRYGGEEFLVIATNTAGLIDDALYERLRAAIARHRIATRAGRIGITMSVGVADTSCGETVDALLAAADAALYRAKEAGRNRVMHARHLRSEKGG